MQKHPDADAFMRSYLAQPTDATARLVFADWLEEAGEPHNAAWAHYIRLKIEADRHPFDSRECRDLERQADAYAPEIRANLTIPAALFVGYPKSLLQLLPAPNITVRLADFEVPQRVLELVPESVARENFVLPLDTQARTLLVAAADPRDDDTARKLEFILNCDVVMTGADRDDAREAIDRLYESTEVEYANMPLLVAFTSPHGSFTAPAGPVELDPDAPVVRLVNLILLEATNLGADRVLLYPDLDAVGVRYRIDGEWVERDRMPIRLLRPTAERLAVMAGIPVEWTFANPPSFTPMTGECLVNLHAGHFRVRVTVQPSPDGPTTQIDLVRNSDTSF